MDCEPPVSSVCGILQARILEWVAMVYFRGSFQPRDRTQVSNTAGGFHQRSPKYWSEYPIPSPGNPKNQELIQALLNHRQIFYQLSYQGSPFISPVQFFILHSSHIFSSMFTICSRLYLLCFFLCYFIFFVHAYLCVCVFCLVFWKTWIAS